MNLALTDETLAKLTQVQEKMLTLPQEDVHTEHFFHAGMYVRTVTIGREVVLMGALIKIPTLLIVSGKTKVFTGDGWIELQGYNVIPAKAGRKQIFVGMEETHITMIFHTNAETLEQAEEEFTGEYEALVTRR